MSEINKNIVENAKTPENLISSEISRSDNPMTIPLSEIRIPTDNMYEKIAETLNALETTCIDGYNPNKLLPELQAHNTKRFFPDTELEMLHSNAVPLSEIDVQDYQKIIKRTNSLQFRIEQLKMPTKTLTEITGSRVRIAYRLTRYMTHIRGIGNIGEPLTFSTASANAQLNLLEMPLPFNPAVGWYRGLTAVRNLLAEETENNRTYTYLINGEVYKTTGMSVLPPPLHDEYYPTDQQPWHYRRIEYTPEQYNPCCDGPLNTYLNICEFLVRLLEIGKTDIEEQAAVIALLNPKIARLAWPCRDDIENFEEYVLLPYINNIIVETSRIKAIERVKKELRLTQAEAFDLVETAITYSEQAFTFDPNREKSIMLNKLHSLADDCSEAGMVTTQHNSYKTILQILGLTKHEEDTNTDKREVLSSALEADVKQNFLPIEGENE